MVTTTPCCHSHHITVIITPVAGMKHQPFLRMSSSSNAEQPSGPHGRAAAVRRGWSGWWLVVGGWWLVAGGWTGLGWLDWTWSVGRLWSCSVSCLVFAVCGGWGCFRLVLFVPWCCLGVWCLHVALAFAVVLPWFGDAWCCFGSIGAARLLGGVAWWCCLVLLGWLGVGASTATGVDG